MSNTILPVSNNYGFYISAEAYQEIEGMLRYTGKLLNSDKLNALTQVRPGDPLTPSYLQALGPKSLESRLEGGKGGLIDWYLTYFLPTAEAYGHWILFPYLDHVGNITIGLGTNLSDKSRLNFNPTQFLLKDNINYREQIIRKLKTIIKSFYIRKDLNIKEINAGHFDREATHDEILNALSELAYRAIHHQYGQKLDSTTVFATEEELKKVTFPDVKQRLEYLQNHFPKFSYFPAGAQIALLDLAYSTGYTSWPKEGNLFHPLYEQMQKKSSINWHKIAYGPLTGVPFKTPAINIYTLKIKIKSKKIKDKKTKKIKEIPIYQSRTHTYTDHFLFWRPRLDEDTKEHREHHIQDKAHPRNIVTQILFILADEWEKKASLPDSLFPFYSSP